jgi:hypothetical protein
MRVWFVMVAVAWCTGCVVGQDATAWYSSGRLLRLDRDPGRLLATRPPARLDWHHTRHAPAIGNGRLWLGEPVVRVPRAVAPRSGRGPDAFGLPADLDAFAFAKVGTEVLAFEPWERFGRDGFGTLDKARAVWLRERGLTGGVRSFVNPVRGAEEGRPSGSSIEPSGSFRRPTVLPRTKPIEQVRYSLPPGMDPRLASALRGPTSEIRRASR